VVLGVSSEANSIMLAVEFRGGGGLGAERAGETVGPDLDAVELGVHGITLLPPALRCLDCLLVLFCSIDPALPFPAACCRLRERIGVSLLRASIFMMWCLCGAVVFLWCVFCLLLYVLSPFCLLSFVLSPFCGGVSQSAETPQTFQQAMSQRLKQARAQGLPGHQQPQPSPQAHAPAASAAPIRGVGGAAEAQALARALPVGRVRMWMHDIAALVNTTSFTMPSSNPPNASNVDAAGRRGNLGSGKGGSKDRGSQFDLLVALTSLTMDLPAGCSAGQVVAQKERRMGDTRTQEAADVEQQGRKFEIVLGTLALLVRRRHSHSVRSPYALGPGDEHLNSASVQDSDVDLCHLHTTGRYQQHEDEDVQLLVHGHPQMPSGTFLDFLYDCGYLGIMWMKNLRIDVEHLLRSGTQPCEPHLGGTDGGGGGGVGRGIVSVLFQGAHVQVAASLDSLHGMAALVAEIQQAQLAQAAGKISEKVNVLVYLSFKFIVY